MTNKDKEILRDLCLYWQKEFDCICAECPLYGLLWCSNKVYEKGWSMKKALRLFKESAISEEDARKIIEKKLGWPLDIVQMVLREMEDFEKS